jgi:hypothetical protein
MTLFRRSLHFGHGNDCPFVLAILSVIAPSAGIRSRAGRLMSYFILSLNKFILPPARRGDRASSQRKSGQAIS